MKKYIKNIINPFLIFSVLLISSSLLYSQTYDPLNQNRDWDADATQSTVFFKTTGTNLEITPNLRMFVFQERGSTATFGGSWVNTTDPNGDNYYDNHSNTIPNGWTYEISDSQGSVTSNTVTVSADKKKITFSGEAPEDLTIYLNIIDANGDTIDALGNVQLDLYIRGNFTISQQAWSACKQEYIIEVNEIVVDGKKPCSPYRIIVYNRTVDANGTGTIDTSTVVYDSNNDPEHSSSSNVFNLKLDIGKYSAIITNSCEERYNGENGYYDFEISNVYAFGASVVFAGFQCLDDAAGTAIVKVEGAAIPLQEWKLTNKATEAVISTATYNTNGTTASSQGSFSFQNFEPSNFSTQNFTVTIPDLPTDTYIFYFKDKNGCEDSVEFEVKKPEDIEKELIVDESKTSLDCHGDSDGKLTFIGSGGWTEPWSGNTINPNGWGASYTFKLLDVNGNEVKNQTGNRAFGDSGQIGYKTSFTGLTAGIYTLVISENIATNPFDTNILYVCAKTFTETFEITQPDQLVINSITTSDFNGFGVKCNGDSNGTINLNVSGGTTDYSFAWTKDGVSIDDTTQNLSGLSAGTYAVTVTDANGCTTSASAEITESVELEIEDEGLSTAIACYGDNGQIQVNITGDSNNGGTSGVYTYTLTGTDYNGNAVNISEDTTELNYTFNPKAGTYKVKVTDVNDCYKETVDITLTQPENPLSLSLSDTDITCFGLTNGAISASVSGGTANYTYAWTKDGTTIANQTSANLSNLGPGTYAVTVTDANGCTINDSVVISQPDDLVITENITNFEGYEVSCFGADDAAIDITVTGGTPNYTYQWSTSDGGVGLKVNEPDQSGLSPGTYKVVVTDSNGCPVEKTYIIEEPEQLTSGSNVPTTNGFAISCNGENDGAINITPSGGTGVYSYNWSSSVNNSGIIQGQQNQSGLKPGVYSVIISDSNQCSTTLNFTLTEPNAINASATLSNYNGFEISKNGAQDGSINLDVSGGHLNNGEDYTYNWSTDVANSGLVQGEKDQIGLKAGEYTVIITDSNECSIVRNYTLNEPVVLSLDLTKSIFGSFNIKCFGDNNGSIDLTITGGSGSNTIVWTTSDGGTGLVQGQEDQSGLGPGTYTVSVTDSNGANASGTVEITEPEILEVNHSIPLFNGFAISCNGGKNGSIDITTSGGTEDYTFNWSTSDGDGLVNGQEDQSGLKAGTYLLTVTDSNGCSETKSYILEEPDAINVSATLSDYNGFEVSGAGKEDGEINITVIGGISDYSFQWTTNNGGGNLVENAEDQTGLSAGTYTVLITDQNGCSDTKVYTLSEPEQISISSSVSIFSGNFNISCKDADDGFINITPSGGSGSYLFIWSTVDGTELVQGNQNQTDLGPGTYSLILRDSNGNEATEDFTLVEPDEVIISQSSTSNYNNFEVSCFGGADGEINITPTGGSGIYTYTWTSSVENSGLVQGQKNQSGLVAGSYTVVVKDENDCEISQTFNLTSPTAITIEFTKKDFNGFNVSCNGSLDGEIDIQVSGGYLDVNSAYNFTWSTNNGDGLNTNSEDQTGLKAGIYTVLVEDDNGCTISQVIEITEPDILGITEIISDYNGFQISEAGENDGSIDITVSGGTSNYSYEWSTLDGSGLSPNSEDQNSLTAGTYTVLVTDTNGCQITKEYTLNEPKELIIAIDHDANGNSILCYGETTATIKIDVTQESVSPYDFTISGTTYLNQAFSETALDINAPTYSFGDLPAGQYILTVIDANGVSRSTPMKEIFGPTAPLTMTTNVSEFANYNISCPGADDATINLTVSGGGGVSNQATYFYSWSTPDGSGLVPNSEDQSGLGPGTYTVVVKDINDCSITETFTITEAPALTYNLDSIKNITCNGDNDGEINITVSGGTGDYTFEWSTENGSGIVQGQEDQSGLGPGTYKLILRDGCNTFEYLHTITTPGILAINLDEKVNILCHDDSTGVIGITVSGGTFPYNYVWKDNFGNVYDRNVGNVFNNGDLSNIPAGIYELTVTDANDCVATFTTELTQPEDLVIDIEKTDLNCFNSNDGSISITPSGGVAPYFYSWSDFGNGNIRNGLSAGSYTVTITDSNGCEEVREIEINNAELFDVNPTVTPVSCFGADDGSIEMNFEGGVAPISFTWLDDSTAGQNRYNLSPGIYSVLIKDSAGCEIERDFTIIEPQEIEITGVLTNAIDCDNPASGSIDLQVSGGNAPYTFQWSNGATTEDISGLIANNYLVKVTDSKGCTSEKEFIINRQDDLVISLDTSLYAICETKEVYQKNIVSVSGGVAPYTIEWSNGLVTGNNGEIMDTKIEGSYQVTVTDFLGCSESIVFQVETPTIGSPDFDYTSFYFTTFDALAINDPITFNNLSTEQYFNSYWDFGDGNTSNESNPTHTYTRRGVYEVTLTVEFILGCSYSITKTIYVGDQYEIVIPNAFTPNNDGYNDTFRPVYYGFSYIIVQVFDTWGTLIYTEEATTNELIGWDGKIKGKDAENGNYFYQVSGVTFTEDTFSKNGAFTLLK